jgi:hypothetical protein
VRPDPRTSGARDLDSVLLEQNLRRQARVRRLARTSERTSMRCSSRPLIVTKSNLCLPNLIFGRVVGHFNFALTMPVGAR